MAKVNLSGRMHYFCGVMRLYLIVALVLPASALGQKLSLPETTGWNRVEEGREISFRVGPSNNHGVTYSLEAPNGLGMKMDSTGNFSWIPGFDIADRLKREVEVSVVFQAATKDGKQVRQPVNFNVQHVNRRPVVENLPTLYVRQGTPNLYQIPAIYVYDPDGDPVVFKPLVEKMPEGASLTSIGLFTWTPSRQQFVALKNNNLELWFNVQDQPDKAETTGHLRIAQTQLDLPPQLLLVPGDTLLSIRENEIAYFKVYVADPNGDDNIQQVDFIPSDKAVTSSHLIANSVGQLEFNWTPGYDFVDEAEKQKVITLTFFVLDKSNNRVQRKVKVTVNDTEDVVAKDRLYSQKYFNTLAGAKNLIDLLDDNNEALERLYKKARKGKKNRTIINATLGAVTGLSPLVLEPDPSKVVSVIGGTAVLTLNSLEAGQVIGRNANEYQNKIKTNRDLRNQLQLRGNYFARKYALKSTRRQVDFEQDRDELGRMMNGEAVASLGLPGDPIKIPTPGDVKKTFPDFNEDL